TIIISTARLAQIFLIVYILHKAYKSIKLGHIKIVLISVFVGIIVLSSLLWKNTGIVLHKYKQDFNIKESPRLVIWENSIQLIKEKTNILSGVGVGDYQEELDLIHRVSMQDTNTSVGLIGYNPHNQYLEFFITNGGTGFFFICYVLYFLVKSLRL